MKYSFLDGENIYLRPFIKEDEDFFGKWYNDCVTRGKIGEVMPTSLEEISKLKDRKETDRVWFAIVKKSDDKVIGETGLLRMFPAWRTTDLTIIIPDSEDQGLGYGKETINLMMNYAFGYLNYNRISIGVVGFNTQAIEFYKKVGFIQEGKQEQGYYYNYKYYDFIMMRILKDEFLKLNRV